MHMAALHVLIKHVFAAAVSVLHPKTKLISGMVAAKTLQVAQLAICMSLTGLYVPYSLTSLTTI